MPAPSWKILLESRNVFARLAKGSQEPRPCLWNFYLLSRSGGLLLEKLTHSLQIEASKHRLVGCLFLPEGGLLFLPPMIPGFQHGGKADLGDLCSGVVSTELGLCPETTRLLCPWDSPCKNTGVGCHFLLQCIKVKNDFSFNYLDNL